MILTPRGSRRPLSIRAPVDQKPLFAGIAHFHGPPVSHPAAWPRQPRACVNGARYDIISLLGRSVTLVTFHSVGASEIDCCVPRGHGSDCGTFETSPPAKEMSVR